MAKMLFGNGQLMKRTGIALLAVGMAVLGIVSTPVFSSASPSSTVVRGTLPGDTTWTPNDGVVIVQDTLTIPTGATLTVEAGTIIKCDSCNVQVYGTLSLEGTSAAPVVFTPIQDDSVGGDTDGVPQPQDLTTIGGWRISLLGDDSTISINYADLRYIGQISVDSTRNENGFEQPSTAGSFTVTHSTLTAASTWKSPFINLPAATGDVVISDNVMSETPRGSVIRNGDSFESFILIMADKAPTLQGNSITRDSTFAGVLPLNSFIFVQGWTSGTPVISGNHLTGQAQAAIYLDNSWAGPPLDATLLNGNTISDPANNGGLELSTTVLAKSLDLPWSDGDIVPVLNGVEVPDGVTLTINSGTIRIGDLHTTGSGSIIAAGTSTDPVVFFGSYYPAYDASLLCSGITINSGGSLDVNGAIFHACAGSADSGALDLIAADDAASFRIINSSFYEVSGYAIRASLQPSAIPVIMDNTFDPPKSGSQPIQVSDSDINLALLNGNVVSSTPRRLNGIVLVNDIIVADGAFPWDGGMIPVVSGVTVSQDHTLTLNAGAQIKVAYDGFHVSGSLNSAGSSDDPVVFTAAWDDSIGGETDWGWGGENLAGTYVTVDSNADSVSFDHTVFMHANTAIYVNEHTTVYVVNSKFVDDDKAIDAYNAVDRYNDSSFESKYYLGETTILTSLVGLKTECYPPYSDEYVVMSNNWFGEYGVAGVEKGSVPDVTGHIELGPVSMSLGDILDNVAAKFAPTADPDTDPDEYQQQKDTYEQEKKDATDAYHQLTKYSSFMNNVTLAPGRNSIPVTEWTCTIAGVDVPMTSTPVRDLNTAVGNYLSAFNLLPTFPPGVENVVGSFVGIQQWLNETPYLDEPVTNSPDLKGLIISRSTYGGGSVDAPDVGDSVSNPATTVPISADVTDYTIVVPYWETSIAMFPFVLGSWSSPLTMRPCMFCGDMIDSQLQVGKNLIPITISSPDGSSSKDYTMTVIREIAPSDSTLVDLVSTVGYLQPAFSPTTTSYDLVVPANTSRVCINAAVAQHGESIRIPRPSGLGDYFLGNGTPSWNSYSQCFDVSTQATPIELIATGVGGGETIYTLTITKEQPAVVLSAYSNGHLGNKTVGQILSGSVNATPPTAQISWQWLRDWVEIPGATNPTYVSTNSDVGHSVMVRATATTEGYLSASEVSGHYHIIAAPDSVSIGSVTVDGSAQVDQTLTANVSDVVPANATLSWQWMRDGASIPGATDSTYTVTNDDAGCSISVTVTADAGGYASITQTSTSIQIPQLVSESLTISSVLISGSPAVGQLLTATAVDISPSDASVSWQWLRDNVAIPGATTNTYTVSSADAGHTLSVTATANMSGYISTAETAAPVSISQPQTPITVGSVLISGTPEVGQTLTATAVDVSPSEATVSWQWLRDGIAITGATENTYTLTDDDTGHIVSVTATADMAGHPSTTETATPISIASPQTPITIGSVAISGTPEVGQTLTATVVDISPSEATVSWQWLRDGIAIPNATTDTYVLSSDDAHHVISVIATAANQNTLLSTVSAQVSINPVTITANVTIDQPLGATTGGNARIANGTDIYQVTVSLTDSVGLPLVGMANKLTIEAPDGVSVISVIDNGNGSYTLQLGATIAGNFSIPVLVGGEPVGEPVTANFLASAISDSKISPGTLTTVTVYGFLPEERVCAHVDPDLIDLGCGVIGPDGTISFSMTLPANTSLGSHTIIISGETSGQMSIPLEVFAAADDASDSNPRIDTGGLSLHSSSSATVIVIAGIVLLSGIAVFTIVRRRSSSGGAF